jgi:hypothetical protein
MLIVYEEAEGRLKVGGRRVLNIPFFVVSLCVRLSLFSPSCEVTCPAMVD